MREAVAILAHEGLIQQIPQVGIRVRPADVNEVNELVGVRIAIEQMVAAELCHQRSACDLSELDALVEKMEMAEDAGDRVRFLDYDTEFHCRAAELAGFALAANMLRSIRDRIRMLGLDAIETDSNMHEVMADHRAILDAIHDGDAEAARAAIERHLSRTAERLARREADLTGQQVG